jgi:hypothetical protein
MREALEMVAHKIGRILNGDPKYHDSWHDIIGYTKLVADRLRARHPGCAEHRRLTCGPGGTTSSRTCKSGRAT